MKTPKPLPVPEVFWKGLKTRSFGRSILFLGEVGSTNDIARRLAEEGAPEGTVVTAESQTQGRGRRGRPWASTPGKSLLFSIVLRPKLPPDELPKITLAAAVAVARTCRTFRIKAGIKWPNDLLVDGRKLCGILTETAPKKDKMTPVVLGIGINLHQTTRDFLKELRPIATSCFLATGRKVKNALFFQELLRELESTYGWLTNGDLDRVLLEWRKNSVSLGKRVKVTQANGVFVGEAFDIDGIGALLVKTGMGKVERVLSGDVEVLETKNFKKTNFHHQGTKTPRKAK